jgi:hypothetical protein
VLSISHLLPLQRVEVETMLLPLRLSRWLAPFLRGLSLLARILPRELG